MPKFIEVKLYDRQRDASKKAAINLDSVDYILEADDGERTAVVFSEGASIMIDKPYDDFVRDLAWAKQKD